MTILLFRLTFLGGLAGLFFLGMVFISADSAPQEAALAAIAVACAVIPYCMARASQEMDR